jgi:serine/threonine-protein kinase
MVEFLERLGVGFRTEQWIVRADGVVRNAHVFLEEDPAWMREVEAKTTPWLGFTHPRVAEIHSISWARENLVVVTGDERGTYFMRAAKHLSDAREREAWAAAEVLAIADALTAMTRHEPGLVHQRVFDQVIVSPTGYARMRAPIAHVQAYAPGTYLGRGNSIGSLDGMSPEQVHGKRATPASDVFSLGTLLFSAIALRRPYAGANNSDFERMKAISDCVTPSPPSDSLAIWSVLRRALAKQPSERYPTPAAFADALRHAADGEPPPSALTKLATFVPGTGPAPSESVGIIGWRCTKQWEGLTPTQSEGIRYCGECKHEVVEVKSLRAVIPLLGQRCVAYRPE